MKELANVFGLDEKEPEATENYLIFILNECSYGLPMQHSAGISKIEFITPVPFTTEIIIGLFNLRNKAITIIDLKHLLGLKNSPQKDTSNRIVFVKNKPYTFGLIVDRTQGICAVPESKIVFFGETQGIRPKFVSGTHQAASSSDTIHLLSVQELTEHMLTAKYEKKQ